MVTHDPRPNLQVRRNPVRAALARAVESDRKAKHTGTPWISECELEEPFIDQCGMAFASVRIGGKIREIKLSRSKSDNPVEERTMTKTVHGKVRGKIIELAEELGVPEGQEVEITVRVVPSIKATRTGEGFLLTEGALADDPYWDAIMEEVHQERKSDSRRETPE